MPNHPTLSVIVPAYNEEEVLHESYKRLTQALSTTGESYEVIFINDGSVDQTIHILKDLCAADPHIKLVDFARNFGHQIAVSAGLDYASGDAVVIIDADLQDPPELIADMLAKWREGYEVVYGQRTRREGETFFKKFTASAFYRLLDKLTATPIPRDTGDFRLIDRKVADILRGMPEKSRYLRGMVAWVGFDQYALAYKRDPRFAGETKYPLKKMLKLASDGIMSFSYKPLQWPMYFGFVFGCLAFLYIVIVLILMACGVPVPGYHILFGLLSGLVAILMVFLGFQGSYIGRMFEQSQGRPLYIVRDAINFNE